MLLRSVPKIMTIDNLNATNQTDLKRVSTEVLQSFNTWAFKRQQPTEPAELLRFVEWAIVKLLPIQFVLYWGKGPRSRVGEPDLICLKFLSQMGDRIRAVYPPGACFTLVATDTHATHNGHSDDDIASYFSSLFDAASELSYSHCYLSSVLAAQQHQIAERVSAPSEDVLRKLEPCAEKWYRGDGAITQGATQYYQMNMLEKQAVGLAFPRAIFVTFNSAEFRELFPENLPVFYMYSLRKGISVKPWFMCSTRNSDPNLKNVKSSATAATI